MSLQPYVCAFEFHPFQSKTKAGDTVQCYGILFSLIATEPDSKSALMICR